MPATKKAALVSFTGRGLTSRQDVSVEVRQTEPGTGIVFELLRDGRLIEIPARAQFVVNTLRNVVLGDKTVRLCIVEHFLCAASLWGLNDLRVKVEGLEMPLGDGSAKFWIDLFAAAGWERQPVQASIEISQPIVCGKGDRLLIAVPDNKFSASYHMDWNHPLIGKRWQTWDADMDLHEIADARTFGWLKDHQLLGLGDDVVSLTPDGFTKPLRYED